MLNKALIGLVLLCLFSCTRKFQSGETCYKKTKLVIEATSTHKFWDEYLRLRENGYFEYYLKPFISIKQNIQRGTYLINNDSIFLTLCDSPSANFSIKGIIAAEKDQLILITRDTNANSIFYITTNNR